MYKTKCIKLMHLTRHFIQQKLWTWWEKCEVRRVDTDSFPVVFDIGDAPIFSAFIYHGHVLCILWFTFWDCFMSYSSSSVYSLLTWRVCRMLYVVYVVSQTCSSMICFSFYCNWPERIWYSKYWTCHRDSRCSDEGLWKWLQDQPRHKHKSINIWDTCTKVFDSELTSKRVIGLIATLLILMLKSYCILINLFQ